MRKKDRYHLQKLLLILVQKRTLSVFCNKHHNNKPQIGYTKVCSMLYSGIDILYKRNLGIVLYMMQKKIAAFNMALDTDIRILFLKYYHFLQNCCNKSTQDKNKKNIYINT